MAGNKTLAQIMDEWNKDSGCLVAQEGRRDSALRQIPFSSPTANYMTYNGIPRGKVTEFFGPESSGKTTSALDIVSNAQKLFHQEYLDEKARLEEQLEGQKLSAKRRQEVNNRLEKLSPMKIIYLDLENTLDADWAELLGVDMDNIVTITPEADSAEKILQYVLDMIDTGEVGLVVLDSIPCLVPQVIFEESMEKKSYGGVSGPLSVFCSRVNAHLNRNDTTMIFINQEREDMNSTYSTYSTPGGRALKHLYSVRIRFRKGSFVDDRNNEVPTRTVNPAGNIVNMEIIKSKAFKPNRRIGSYTLKYCEGIDVLADLVSLGLACGIVMQSGAWFSVVDSTTGEILSDSDGAEIKSQGMAKFLAMLKEDDYVRDILTEGVLGIIDDTV